MSTPRHNSVEYTIYNGADSWVLLRTWLSTSCLVLSQECNGASRPRCLGVDAIYLFPRPVVGSCRCNEHAISALAQSVRLGESAWTEKVCGPVYLRESVCTWYVCAPGIRMEQDHAWKLGQPDELRQGAAGMQRRRGCRKQT
eukprot:193329-Chlamydomonas_euryale.AAC.2